VTEAAWPDLRLAGLAAGAWLAAVASLHASPAGAATISVCACVLAGGFGRGPAALNAISRTVTGARPGAARRTHGRGERADHAWDVARWVLVTFLLGAVCGAGATAARLTVARAEPMSSLARTHSRAAVALTVVGDPRPVGQSGIGPATYGVDARITKLVANGTTISTSARVFVLASNTGWRGLLPGQRLTVAGRLEPATGANLDTAVVSVSAAPTLLGRPPWTQRAAGSLRAGLQRACAGLPGQVRGLLPGLIDGDTTQLDPAVSAAFRATGMTHLLAVSGSNVAMVVGAVLLVCRWSRTGPTVAAVVCGLALIGFVILVRPTPSVLRAAAMGGLALVGLATGRARAAVPALAAGVTALIVYDPALATDIGFGLSTFATAGLLLIAPHWRDALLRRRMPRGAAEAVAVPAAAQVACAPYIAGFTGTVSIVAVPANLVAVPVVPAATLLGVGAAVVSPVWPGGAAFLAWLASWPARCSSCVMSVRATEWCCRSVTTRASWWTPDRSRRPSTAACAASASTVFRFWS
jgi:competence protein ComEC